MRFPPRQAVRLSTRIRARAITVAVVWTMLAGALSTVLTTVTAQPAFAAANTTIADWEMNEPPGAQSMIDSSGNGINGSIGSAIKTGFVVSGATGYDWTATNPTAPPPKPERLVQIPDARLNPGTRDFAVTVRFRTTHSYGNMIQKGQSTTPGGYWKWEIPNGQLLCLFRSRDQAGNITGQNYVNSPTGMHLNDGAWHTVRCEKTADLVTMTIDGTTVVQSKKGKIGPIANDYPMTIGGKINCDQVTVTCDYFAGDIVYVHIEASSGGGGGGDTTPPTVPGKPTGQGSGPGRIDLSWPGSTDQSPPITYRITATAAPPRSVRPPRRPSPTRGWPPDQRTPTRWMLSMRSPTPAPRARPRTRSPSHPGGGILR